MATVVVLPRTSPRQPRDPVPSFPSAAAAARTAPAARGTQRSTGLHSPALDQPDPHKADLPTPALHIVPWAGPPPAPTGYDVRAAYVERFWLPVLGPSCTWLLRHLADAIDRAPDGFDVVPGELAAALGLGGADSRHAPLQRAIRRCIRFKVLRAGGPRTVAVPRQLPALPAHLVRQLPSGLEAEHRRWVQPIPSDVRQARRRARLLSLDLVILGQGPADVERRLLHWGVHPALAYESAAWGTTRPAFDP